MLKTPWGDVNMTAFSIEEAKEKAKGLDSCKWYENKSSILYSKSQNGTVRFYFKLK